MSAMVRPDVGGDDVDGVRRSGAWARLGSWRTRHRSASIAVLAVYLAVVTVVPGTTTPYRSDDKINQNIPQELQGSGFGRFVSVFEVSYRMFTPWIRDWGRFFPGSSTWTAVVFSTLQDRVAYKIFIAALVLLMMLLVSSLLRTVTGTAVVPVVLVALAGTVTLRNWFDGLDTFTGVVPLSICLTLGSLLLAIRGRGGRSAVAAAVCWTYALITYEVAILLTPTMVITIWVLRRAWRRLLPVAVPAVAVVVLVSILRSMALQPPGNAYIVNLSPDRVVPTYLRQVLSGLPLAEQWYPGAPGFDMSVSLICVLSIVVGVPAAALLTLMADTDAVRNWRRAPLAVLLGASCWLLPPLLIGVSQGWQNELPPGEGYVSVVWGYVGIAVLMAVGWLSVARWVAAAPGPARRCVLHLSSGVIATVVTLNLANSITIAGLVQISSM